MSVDAVTTGSARGRGLTVGVVGGVVGGLLGGGSGVLVYRRSTGSPRSPAPASTARRPSP